MVFKSKTLALALWESIESYPREAVIATLSALQAFSDAYRDGTEARDFFTHPALALSTKEKVIAAFAAAYKVPAETERFLVFLVRHRKIEQMPFVLTSLRRLVDAHFKTVSVQYRVTEPMTSAGKELLEKELKTVLQAEQIDLHETIVPEILGGIVLRMDGELYDASLRTQLRKIQHALAPV